MHQRTALVIGATGLVGSQLVQQLLQDNRFQRVIVFVRRSTGISHAKLQEHIISFDQPQQWQHLVNGDVLFSTLGTTLRQAGSKEAQYKIDYTYQYQFAQAASVNGVPVYVLVSAAMASPDSRIFYSRMKGELEQAIEQLPFRAVRILRPGMLDGDRKEKRVGEKIGLRVLKFLNRFGILKSQKPVPAATVAKAMINAYLDEKPGVKRYELGEVFEAAR
jgi:uncharacterized protein YbjT (DUF2867 family)